jgi:hypothetical protein
MKGKWKWDMVLTDITTSTPTPTETPLTAMIATIPEIQGISQTTTAIHTLIASITWPPTTASSPQITTPGVSLTRTICTTDTATIRTVDTIAEVLTATTTLVTTPDINKVSMTATPIIVANPTIMVFKLVLIIILALSSVMIGRTDRTKLIRELGTRESGASLVTIKDTKVLG